MAKKKDPIAEGLHTSAEAYWAAQQSLLADHGYQLRPRVEDGGRVVIKRVTLELDNVPLLQHLNSPEMRKDPRNNAVPLLDVIIPPTSNEGKSDHTVFLVMPMLFPLMSWHLPFRHVKEIVDVFEQVIQGVAFLHEHNIAHRDACNLNFMMDPTDVIPSSFHHGDNYYQPDGKTRIEFKDRCSVSRVKYYIIDFEFANYFPNNKLCVGLYGQQKDVPEMSRTVPYDPFKLDVFQVGKLIEKFIKKYEGLDFLQPLFEAMTRQDPKTRPTAAEALDQLRQTVSSLTDSDMSSEIWMKDMTPGLHRLQTLNGTPRPSSRRLLFDGSKCRQLLSQSISLVRQKIQYRISSFSTV
uniref:Protein kinase domain-containing protein n=1 Tax=Psilocybe cubensis TaxID=181762 RepID=A0A8H8CK66_PSICU